MIFDIITGLGGIAVIVSAFVLASGKKREKRLLEPLLFVLGGASAGYGFGLFRFMYPMKTFAQTALAGAMQGVTVEGALASGFIALLAVGVVLLLTASVEQIIDRQRAFFSSEEWLAEEKGLFTFGMKAFTIALDTCLAVMCGLTLVMLGPVLAAAIRNAFAGQTADALSTVRALVIPVMFLSVSACFMTRDERRAETEKSKTAEAKETAVQE